MRDGIPLNDATLADLVAKLGPHARAAVREEAAQAGDIVVVTIPLKDLRDVPVAPLAGSSWSALSTTRASMT